MTIEASNAKEIIGMVIEQANFDGTIDVMGFLAFWKETKESFDKNLTDSAEQLDFVRNACDFDAGVRCTSCVCQFRIDFIEDFEIKLENVRHPFLLCIYQL